MNPISMTKLFCLIFSLLVALTAVSAAPYSSDYDNNIRDIFEILMQRDNLEDRMGLHQVARRSRGPQLRLRFGKRPDVGFEPVVVERPPSLRLRFGKRSDDSSVPAYMTGFSSEGEN